MEQTAKKRILYLDAARCLAVLLIALNHAVNRTWDNYNDVPLEFAEIGKLSTLLKASLTVASHLGVPLFLMITGALLLRRRFETREDLRHFLLHNWLRLLITAEIWFFLGYWFQALLNPAYTIREQGIDAMLRGCVKTLLFLDQLRFDSMWYVPMILTVYLMIPVLAVFLRQRQLRPALLPAALLLFWTSMLYPAINAWLRMFGRGGYTNYPYYSNLFSMYLLYVLAGWGIAEGGLRRLPGKGLICGTIMSFLLCTALQFLAYSRSAHLLEYASPGILLTAALLFECFRRYAESLRRWEKPLDAVSRSAFALYLLHVYPLAVLTWFCDLSAWPHTAKVLLLEIAPLALSGLIIRPLAKIPLFRKYVFLIK